MLSTEGQHHTSPSLCPSFKHTAHAGMGRGPHLLPELDDRRGGILRGHIQGAIGPLELHAVVYPWVPGKEARERSFTIWHGQRQGCEIIGQREVRDLEGSGLLKLSIQNLLEHEIPSTSLPHLVPHDLTCGLLDVTRTQARSDSRKDALRADCFKARNYF